jgi:catechol 2,3-dioxygenase-like lactoylglutathione lyase family enzyme
MFYTNTCRTSREGRACNSIGLTNKKRQERMKIRLHHVSMPMPPGNATVARAFYGNTLGLEEVAPPPNVADLEEIWYQLAGDTELHLFTEPPMGQDHSARHFCLAVEDVEALRAQLEAAGIAVVGGPSIPNRPRYFCRDPFGNLLEITTIQSQDRK